MKTVYCVLLCCSCLVSCHSQTKSKEMKFDLNLSLFLYPSMSIGDIRYSVDIINDSLIINKNNAWGNNEEYRGKLTDNQCSEVKELTSELNQKYDRSDNVARGGWGCTLKVDNQVYYEDNHFTFIPRSEKTDEQSTPEEIKLLIDYIVNLSPIPIELYWF